MAKKSINDPDFFDDAHLDAVGEAVESLQLDDEGGAGDDVADEGSADDADDADEEASGEDVGDSDGDTGVADESAEGDVSDPAPHLDDLDTAKVAYAELRKWANQRDMEARKAAERLAEFEAAGAAADDSFDYGEYDDTPAYDSQQFAYMASQDPRAAFRYALDGGQDSDAQAAIAKVQSDAQEVAAMAALAHRDGNGEAYQQLNQQAVNLNSLAQSMHGELQQSATHRAQAPIVEWQRNQNLAAAEQQLAQQYPEYAARRDQVIQVLRQQPNLLSDHSLVGLRQGLETAYARVALQPAPVQQQVTDIDSVVKQAVDKHIAETRRAKSRAADAASGGGSDRSAPTSGGTQEPSLKDQIYSDQAAASIGPRKFMSL